MSECYPGIENTPLYEKLKECMRLRIPNKFVNEFNYSDGSRGFFDLRMEPIEEGVLIMSFDITEQKSSEIALAKKVGETEKMLNIITGQKKQLEDFCHIIAHNMRGPLTN